MKGILKVVLSSLGIEGSRKNVEFLMNSLLALGVEKVWVKVPPLPFKEYGVRELRFYLFGRLSTGLPVEIAIVEDESLLSFLEEELGSGLTGAIITFEPSSKVFYR